MKIGVIGSGPSGWATYQKLTQLGHDVWILDAGLNSSIEGKDNSRSGTHRLARKLYFGSDFPYRDYPFGPQKFSEGVNPLSSFAVGGLSLVWGATMLPYCEDDFKSWPLGLGELDEYYKEVVDRIPVCGDVDDLSKVYGNYFSRRGIFQSERMVRFLERLSLSAPKNTLYGSSRLAVETGTLAKVGCNYCGLCLSGCPGDHIWSTKNEFLGASVIQIRVISLIENGPYVEVSGLDLEGKKIDDLLFDKVFLAAGPLETFRILASSNIVPKKVLLKDSATYFLPLLASSRLGRWKGNYFALSQVFLKVTNTQTGLHSQFQLYEYSEDMISRARNAIPLGAYIPSFVLAYFLKRMVVAIGYLEGTKSPQIEMTFTESGDLKLLIAKQGVSISERNSTIRQAIRNLRGSVSSSGLLPLPFLTQFAEPGEGVHFGSWLPMGISCDLLGRPDGCVNLHVVDSSILPSIASGPITFTVMANAMRIATEVCQ
jgi:hypothetical protein